MHILEKIVHHKRKEIQTKRELFPKKLLEQSLFFDSPCVSLSRYLKRTDKVGIIAEFKRRSPSKPSINLFADVEKTTIGYMMAGASALSVLTDEYFFGGKNQDLKIARKYNYCPVLRKDFIIDEYQIIEARSIGADAILLIAEILTKKEVDQLSGFARKLGMEVLLEVHSESQIQKCNEFINVIGVNNRNLDTFKVNPEYSLELVDKIPPGVVKISESGIHSAETVFQLKEAGYQGFLIGEKFMNSADPVEACTRFIEEVKQLCNKAKEIVV